MGVLIGFNFLFYHEQIWFVTSENFKYNLYFWCSLPNPIFRNPNFGGV
jgi:hypothetical protein